MAFLAELATLSGEARGQPAWRGLTVERNLNGGTTVSLSVDTDDQAAPYVRVGDHALRLWEDGVLRFHGKLREPLVVQPGTLSAVAGSPYTLLDRRQLQTSEVYTDIDQGAILEDVLETQNARSPTRLRMGPYIPTKLRDRSYERGKSVQEIVAQMASVIDGPYFVEQPVLEDASPDVFAELALRWPDPGMVRPGARFEYGEDTLRNVLDYTLTTSLPVNAVTFIGGTNDSTPDPPEARVYHSTSIAQYDLMEAWYDDPDVTLVSTLVEAGKERIRPDPYAVVEFTAARSGEQLPPSRVPRLWHDFDVGDTVFVSVRDAGVEFYDLPLVVSSAKLTVSEVDDSEQIELVAETLERVAA